MLRLLINRLFGKGAFEAIFAVFIIAVIIYVIFN